MQKTRKKEKQCFLGKCGQMDMTEKIAHPPKQWVANNRLPTSSPADLFTIEGRQKSCFLNCSGDEVDHLQMFL